ncbi:UNVERIFIED_CONTAM: Beta-amylase 8 [Sesamum radiatum]|uniref:Beta-amylase n=1 Tax=Sesamum radiatum TaxID=300843 RepID=A0AAW2KZA5_SESRA
MNTNVNTMNHSFAVGAQDLEPQQSPPPPTTLPPIPPPSQPQRPPPSFAATNSNNNTSTSTSTPTKSRKEREKEKERTKLRERHRRAITSRMLAGLRQYGNFPSPARADMNDVIAALAREAGWTVEADGTTYRQSSPAPPPQAPMAQFNSAQQNNINAPNMGAHPVRSVESPYSSSIKNCSMRSSVDCQPSALRVDENLSPASLDSVAAERDGKLDKYSSATAINSPECLEAGQLVQDVHCRVHGNGLSGTSYIPVYVRLATGLINNFCQLMDPEGIKEELQHLNALHVDGIVVDCWWGIVEAWAPKKYEWAGYREMFNIIREFGMKLQVLNAAWDQGLSVAGQNGQPCYDREGFMRLVETARPRNNPDCRHFSFFVFQQPSPLIQRTICFSEIDYFIKSMHGDVSN